MFLKQLKKVESMEVKSAYKYQGHMYALSN